MSKTALDANCRTPIIEISKIDRIRRALENQSQTIGTDLITRHGEYIGEIVDIYFEKSSGLISGLVIASSTNNDEIHAGEFYIPVLEPLNMTNGFVLASVEMLEQMQEVNEAQ